MDTSEEKKEDENKDKEKKQEENNEQQQDDNVEREYLRALQKRGNFILVHWWFYPDSYDTWLTVADITGPPPSPMPNYSGKWKVTSKWLFDLEKFNEYMNENDYNPSSKFIPKQYRISVESSLTKRTQPPETSPSQNEEPPKKQQKIEDYEAQKYVFTLLFKIEIY